MIKRTFGQHQVRRIRVLFWYIGTCYRLKDGGPGNQRHIRLFVAKRIR